MGILKDWKEDNGGLILRYKVTHFLSPRRWFKIVKYRRDRANNGWSSRDTWNGGEYIMEVTAGILRYLEREQNPIDWDAYFKMNYEDNEGYKRLSEVAQDLENYLDFSAMQYSDPLYGQLDSETRWAIEYQLYENSREAMQFVAKNIGGLWW